jgi:ABC-2 type transport system permease protein
MQVFLTLTRRELGSFFLSWTGYAIIAAVVFLLGFSFATMLDLLNAEPTPVPVTQLFCESYYFWIILLLASPIITMRSFAQEKASGTYETLMTAPVGDAQVVLAKFAGAMLFYLIVWLPLVGCVLVVRHYSNDPTVFDPAAIATTYLGILLWGSVSAAMGIFASATTRSVIIAAAVSIAMGLTLFITSFQSSALSAQTGVRAQLASHLALMEHMGDFAQGVIDVRPLVLCLSLTCFFLFLSWKAVESRRWK